MATGYSENLYQQGTGDAIPIDSLLNSNAFDERKFILRLLGEKRTLLAALHNEKKDKLKWKGEYERQVEENEKLRRPDDVTHAGSLAPMIAALNLNGETDSETKTLYRKLREKDEKIHQLRGRTDSLLSQVAVLKSEVIRLAASLSKHDVQLETELLREQLVLYEEDFRKEKDDKVTAQEKFSILNEQLRDNKEMIQSITVELDMYKKGYEREKQEKEKILLRTFHQGSQNSTNSSGSTSGNRPPRRCQSLPKPHLQVVYPVTTDQDQQDEQRRRQRLQRVGVYARDMQRSPTYLYSGKDMEDGLWWSS